MNVTPLPTTGHVMPLGESITAPVSYTIGGGFSNGDVAHISITLRFGDNTQTRVQIQLSKQISFVDFVNAHRDSSGQPVRGLVVIYPQSDQRLALRRLFACGRWHDIVE